MHFNYFSGDYLLNNNKNLLRKIDRKQNSAWINDVFLTPKSYGFQSRKPKVSRLSGMQKEMGEEGEELFEWAIVFLSNGYAWWGSAFLEMAEHLTAHGKEWMNSLFCFACMWRFCFISTQEWTHSHPSGFGPYSFEGVISCWVGWAAYKG